MIEAINWIGIGTYTAIMVAVGFAVLKIIIHHLREKRANKED